MSNTVLREELEQYENWKSEHRLAMFCHDLQEVVALGVFLFSRISHFDNEWHRKVFGGEQEYSKEEEEMIESLYRLWYSPCHHIGGKIAKMEEEGHTIDGSEEFRKCCNEAQGVLTPDDEFFSGDALAALRDDAIDENRNGETVSMGDLAD